LTMARQIKERMGTTTVNNKPTVPICWIANLSSSSALQPPSSSLSFDSPSSSSSCL